MNQMCMTEHVETVHLVRRISACIAKEHLNSRSVTCVIKPVNCHDHAYLLCLMTVKVISLLNFMYQHTQVLNA